MSEMQMQMVYRASQYCSTSFSQLTATS